MIVRQCPVCSEANPEHARFCLACGTRLEAEAASRELRKTVTIVFADLTGSTAMAELLDPETVREVMSRYYAQMRSVLERHGGTVEKFIGDAVMAVFGVPVRHEDDAVRAVRAAVDMRDALAALNRELEARYEVRLQARTGVNTGSVVAGDSREGHAFVSGDAVNVAARLEQAAAPGQILLGESTQRLVRSHVAARSLTPLSVKGKSESLAAFELVEIAPEDGGGRREADLPLAGRDVEIGTLRDAFERSREERRCRLICLVGTAGVGKSRLIKEFVGGLNGAARVLAGRCLPYGEGITYWPLVEVVQQAAGISPIDTRDVAFARLAALLEGQDSSHEVLQRVAGVLDLNDDVASIQDTFWAIRRLFDALAQDGPLVVVVDDLQWAEPTFLDLVDHLTQIPSERPMLLVCVARPELLEVRPAFADAETVLLEPLRPEHCARLVTDLLRGASVADDVARRVIDAAAGQPLFLVEYVRMLRDDGLLVEVDGEWRFTRDVASVAVPASIEALLGARIDRLTAPEREVIQSAAVIGQNFSNSAVQALVAPPVDAHVAAHLSALVTKQLIREEDPASGLPDELSFSHLLIRDVAYATLLKQTRAELHERFARWLEQAGSARVEEHGEILGYHLEQAYRYRIDLGPADEGALGLADDAAGRLATAGRRALAHGDAPAAVNLLGRAAALVGHAPDIRCALLVDLGVAQADTGQLQEAEAGLRQALALARARANRLLEWRARCELITVGLLLYPDPTVARAEAERAIAAFNELGASSVLGRAWRAAAYSMQVAGDIVHSNAAYEEALVHARRHRDRRTLTDALTWILVNAWGGPTPAPEAIERCEDALATTDLPRQVMAYALIEQAPLRGMLGDFEQGRQRYQQGIAILEELGLTTMAATVSQEASELEMLAGDPAAAEGLLRSGCHALEAIGGLGFLASSLPRLADAVYAQARYEEADTLVERGRAITVLGDVDAEVRWRGVKAKVLARRGEFTAAEALAREAKQLIEGTDYLPLHGDTVMNLAEVLSLAGSAAGARTAAAAALALFERKGNQTAAERARRLLDAS